MFSNRLWGWTGAALLALSLAACGSDSGSSDSSAGDGPGDRSKLYCNYSGANLDDTHLTTSVYCNQVTDMPWTGGCEAGDIPRGLYLSVSQPVDWDKTDVVAGWTCTWAPYDAAPALTFGANAEICCYSMGGT